MSKFFYEGDALFSTYILKRQMADSGSTPSKENRPSSASRPAKKKGHRQFTALDPIIIFSIDTSLEVYVLLQKHILE